MGHPTDFGQSLHQRPPMPTRLPLPVFDNHTHLDHEDDGEVGALLELAAKAGIEGVVQIGCTLPAARWTVDAVGDYPQMIGGVAIHPNEAAHLESRGQLAGALEEMDQLLTAPGIRVCGETGLDYYRTRDPQAQQVQREAFRWHISAAKRHNLVLQIHDRDAHDDVLAILDEEGAPARTVMHCFSGDAEFARACVERGFWLSFAGNITFKNADDLREAYRATPSHRALVETDAPYLTPMPHRGRPNSSYLLPLTVAAMAELRGEPLARVCDDLRETSLSLYQE